MKAGAVVLAIGGIAAASAQAAGYVRSAGIVMLAANAVVLVWWLLTRGNTP